MNIQEYFNHAAQLGWFCRAPFGADSEISCDLRSLVFELL
jgi:hypothetical protein